MSTVALAAEAPPLTMAQIIGAAIREARLAAGVATQSELARIVTARTAGSQIRPEHVGRWERGTQEAGPETLDRIARALGRPVKFALPGGSVVTVTPPLV